MKKILFILCLLFCASQLMGQDNVGIGTNTPHSSAALDVTSNTKGVLFPRMSSAQRAAISGIEGLLVYDTDSSNFFFHDGSVWVALSKGITNVENGLIIDPVSNKLKIGGELIEPTTLKHGNYTFHHNLNGSGDFKIQDNGVFKFGVIDNGRVTIGANANVGAFNVTGQSFYSDKLTLRDGAVGAVDLIKINREAGAGVVETLKSGVVKNRIHADSSSYVTGGNFGIGTSTPNPRATLELNDTEDGFLPTRSTRVLMDATPLTAAEAGMLYFDTNTKKYNQWDGSQWNELRTGSDLWEENAITNLAYYDAGDVAIGSSNATSGAKLTVRHQGTSSLNTNSSLSIENSLSSPFSNYGLHCSVSGSGGATQTGAGIFVNTFANPSRTYGQYTSVTGKSSNSSTTTRGSFFTIGELGTGPVYGHQTIVNGGAASSVTGSQLTARSGANQAGDLIGSEVVVDGSDGGTNEIIGSLLQLTTGKFGWVGIATGQEIDVTAEAGWGGQTAGSRINVRGSNGSGFSLVGQSIEVGSTLSNDPAKIQGVFVRANAQRDTNVVAEGAHFYARKIIGGTNTADLIAVHGEVNDENSSGKSISFLGYNRKTGENDFSFYSQNGHAFFDDDVRIGDENDVPGYKVSVKGGIIADSLRLLPFGAWPDYVFDEDYNLLSLEEVKAHIQSKKHLPGIPSAAEIENSKGIELFEMNKMLLEKIEELTLHAIRLNEENKSIQRDNNQLNKRLNSFESELLVIKNMLKK